MRLKDFISEGTYDNIDGLTRVVAKFLDTKLKGRDQSQINWIDITEVIPKELNPKNRKVFIRYLNARQAKKRILNNVGIIKNGDITMDLFWERDFHELYSEWKGKPGYKAQSFEVIKTMRHELVHVLDYLADLHTKKYDNSVEPDFLTNPLTLWKNSFEFNQIIHMLKEYKKRWPGSWDKITKYPKLIEIIDKHGLLFRDSDEHLRKDPSFKRDLLARLSREGLKPPNI